MVSLSRANLRGRVSRSRSPAIPDRWWTRVVAEGRVGTRWLGCSWRQQRKASGPDASRTCSFKSHHSLASPRPQLQMDDVGRFSTMSGGRCYRRGGTATGWIWLSQSRRYSPEGRRFGSRSRCGSPWCMCDVARVWEAASPCQKDRAVSAHRRGPQSHLLPNLSKPESLSPGGVLQGFSVSLLCRLASGRWSSSPPVWARSVVRARLWPLTARVELVPAGQPGTVRDPRLVTAVTTSAGESRAQGFCEGRAPRPPVVHVTKREGSSRHVGVRPGRPPGHLRAGHGRPGRRR